MAGAGIAGLAGGDASQGFQWGELAGGFVSGGVQHYRQALTKFAGAAQKAAWHTGAALGLEGAGIGIGAGIGWQNGGAEGTLIGAQLGQLAGGLASFAVACFTAGTPLVIDHAGNSRPIEEIEVGDYVLARSEFDPDGPLELKRVEEKFVRVSPVMELVIAGRSIKTTTEHPFYVPSRQTFIPAGELKAGDELVSHDGRLIAIESVNSTDEVATVYNMRVADHHTYFVGGEVWGWDVWVHNATYQLVTKDGKTTLKIYDKFEEGSSESNQLRRFVSAWNAFIESNGGSLTRRKLSDAEEKASAVWKRQMKRNEPTRFDGKVVGHVPDAAAGGPAKPPDDKAMALLNSVNSYVGGMLPHIPIGTVYHKVSITKKALK